MKTAGLQEPGTLAPLPATLPPSVKARVGKIDFRQGLPSQKGIEQLFEIQYFQRATQLYQWAIPAIGVMGWHRASLADGKTGETDWVTYDDYVPRQDILTPNTSSRSCVHWACSSSISLEPRPGTRSPRRIEGACASH
jgi:hypothetical protein